MDLYYNKNSDNDNNLKQFKIRPPRISWHFDSFLTTWAWGSSGFWIVGSRALWRQSIQPFIVCGVTHIRSVGRSPTVRSAGVDNQWKAATSLQPEKAADRDGRIFFRSLLSAACRLVCWPAASTGGRVDLPRWTSARCLILNPFTSQSQPSNR